MKQGDLVKIIADCDPYLKKGMMGKFQRYSPQGGWIVKIEGYRGFGKTYGSKGNNAHLAPEVVGLPSIIDLLKEYIKGL